MSIYDQCFKGHFLLGRPPYRHPSLPVNDGTEGQTVLEAVSHVIDRQAVVGFELFLEPRRQSVWAHVTFSAKPLLLVRRRMVTIVTLSDGLHRGHGVGSLDCLEFIFDLDYKRGGW